MAKLATKMFYYMVKNRLLSVLLDPCSFQICIFVSKCTGFCSEMTNGDSSVFIKIGICFYVFLLIICSTTISRLGICSFV
jgi:hypothetical protein